MLMILSIRQKKQRRIGIFPPLVRTILKEQRLKSLLTPTRIIRACTTKNPEARDYLPKNESMELEASVSPRFRATCIPKTKSGKSFLVLNNIIIIVPRITQQTC